MRGRWHEVPTETHRRTATNVGYECTCSFSLDNLERAPAVMREPLAYGGAQRSGHIPESSGRPASARAPRSTTGDSAAGRVEVVVIEEGTAGGGDAAGDEGAASGRPA